MPILKYLLLALVLVWLFYSPALKGLRNGGKAPTQGGKQAGKPPSVEPMVQCAHCGIHLPNGEAFRNPQGQAFCSAAHLQAGPRR